MQFLSDVHLEFIKSENINLSDFLDPVSDYLAIVGDLGYPHSPLFEQFLIEASKVYKKVFYVSGNHEYYCCKNSENPTMVDIDTKIESICAKLPNVFYLNNKEYVLDNNTVILGTTLWSHIPISKERIIKNCINDYKYIYVNEKHYKTNVTCKFISSLHDQAVTFLKDKLEEHKDKKIIVLSHHLPSFEMVAEQYKDEPTNYAFATGLDELMEENDNIIGWLCGHTHTTMTAQINNCLCMTNPMGYNGENEQYDKKSLLKFNF